MIKISVSAIWANNAYIGMILVITPGIGIGIGQKRFLATIAAQETVVSVS